MWQESVEDKKTGVEFGLLLLDTLYIGQDVA